MKGQTVLKLTFIIYAFAKNVYLVLLFRSYLSAKADNVFPQLFGLAFIILSPCLNMHALSPLQGLHNFAEGEVLLGCVAGRTILGFDVVQKRTGRAAPLPDLLLQI